MRKRYYVKLLKAPALLLLTGLISGVQAGTAERSGETVYQEVCQYCHDTGVGPKLKERQLPTAYISHVVRHGQRAMPPFRATEINDTELGRVAVYIESSVGERK